MTRALDPERLARAYVSTVTQGPSRAVEQLIASRGVIDAAATMRTGDVPKAVWDRISARAHLDSAAQSLDMVAALDGRLVIPSDEEWPAWRFLGFDRQDGAPDRRDAGAPFALWVVGSASIAASSERAVAVVGTRAATSYGEHVTAEIAGDLAVDGWTVVSGGAYGIDGAAHRAALGVGGCTVAVLACGVDRAYPAGHERLLRRVSENGAVISEYPPGTHPARYRFLARNRVVAALSDGVVVVEAGWRSGARNTASWARSLGRPVMAVPGPVTSASSTGCHRMIREGEARLITGARDVAAEVGVIGTGAGDDDAQDALFGRDLDRLPATPARVLDAFPASGARSVQELSVDSGVTVSAVRSALVVLEIEGHAGRDESGWFRIGGL
ncbi:DNA protecting protein DprA [Rhodococcus sp. Leaf7]|uniref:DNA-processing protein DprA n=1 Tax=unclassified Rhodococcus (in: high G+C Gram-positive bacteria) TaxID=192944 RepID=UPI0006F4B6CF|nr:MULTISPECIES: DNA-processing protein DprA [unclassified Rhodococcus (in: high G+C Gram-positive bacteria)]KQU02773.1 DNA protecting protein DprA [Rhodococcus sp. Leaf7]KQU38571.1 DNA protecting protein DprA [Rhodococcus sp. Leaf247]